MVNQGPIFNIIMLESLRISETRQVLLDKKNPFVKAVFNNQ
jgi:hypothetical protein